MKILFYISGHGFGHATREIAVMQALVEREPGCEIYVRTKLSKGHEIPRGSRAQPWRDNPVQPVGSFADCELPNIKLYDAPIDIGVIEKDIFSQDILLTMNHCAELMADNNQAEIIDDEVEFIRKESIDRIVSDIPPLASAIGSRLRQVIPDTSVRTFAIGNFSWDYIYAPYVKKYPSFKRSVLSKIKAAYRRNKTALRLPLNDSMTEFGHAENIPFIVRKPPLSSRAVLARLKIDSTKDKRPIVLFAFRTTDPLLTSALAKFAKSRSFIVLAVDPPQALRTNPGIRAIGSKWQGAKFPALVAASDVVIAKLGYGIVSECLAGRTRLAYIPRYDFAEFALLKKGIRTLLPSAQMSKSDFLSGAWSKYLNPLLRRKFNWPDVHMNGAEVAAAKILE